MSSLAQTHHPSTFTRSVNAWRYREHQCFTMPYSVRPRLLINLCISLLIISLLITSRVGLHHTAYNAVFGIAQENQDNSEPLAPQGTPWHPIYKNMSPESRPEIVDNFPTALRNIPPIPSWNTPPVPHVWEQTPLFIGFTRNWRLLQQVVVSYITAGWPPEDIYVVENTGVMKSNVQGRLSLQNPFFLNHTRISMLGVNVISTPTLLTFAQLQNFFTYTAIERGWETYWWGHMDAIVLSNEEEEPYSSIYNRAVGVLREVSALDFARHPETNEPGHWGVVFHAYDQLALVHTEAYTDIGGWDTQIPFYMTDCDFHARLRMADWKVADRPLGGILDVATTLEDLSTLYRKIIGPEASFIEPEDSLRYSGGEDGDTPTHVILREIHEAEKPQVNITRDTKSASMSDQSNSDWPEDSRNSSKFKQLRKVANAMKNSKHNSSSGRNTWQSRQTGGHGDPFYRDSAGFELAINMAFEHGREVYREKWGHRDCDIFEIGLKAEDAWKVEHDWKSRPDPVED